MANRNRYKSLPLLEEEQSKFDSISEIPLHLCTMSIDSKEFLVYNVENNKICAKIPTPVSLNLMTQGFLCQLNGSQLFYLGGISKTDKSVGICLLIDIKNLSVEKLQTGRARCFATPVYLEKFVYVFGGRRFPNNPQSFSDKFNLRKNKWKRIANLPFPATQTNTIVYQRKILVSGWKLRNIWNYDPDKNSYESLFEIDKEPWKMFYIYKDQCYVVASDYNCYSSEKNSIQNWTFHRKVSGICWLLSNVCFYNEVFLFFDDLSRICKFDLNQLLIKPIANTSDTNKYFKINNNSQNNNKNS
ncbi:unnamed protein product [Blepharisma stoltei]|uniref:Kelch motif family protein n=1 Tax=Blepharisma stoltei TaxID=1481888 RepID=A0AAU9JMM3_9CILI|nr:unnamed protein product [Blepharisma stoltei]